MIELQGQYYDGKTSNSQAVKLILTGNQLQLTGESVHVSYSIDDVNLQPRLANIAARFEFNDGAAFEAQDQPDLDKVYKQLHQGHFHKIVHKLENKLGLIAITLLIAIAVMSGLVLYGIPQFAKTAAHQIPIEFERRMGEETLTLIDKALCKSSKLSGSRQQDLKQQMLQLFNNSDQFRIEFRHCEKIGANALALPSGIIIFTDDMVKMAEHDHELLGVFAHEVAHIKYRHTLRHVLQDSITGLLIVMLTGDVGSASSMAAALPTILLQTKFSRDFEREADSFAADYLLQKNIEPVHLANILARLNEEFDEDGPTDSFLSTHPLTKDRVNFLTSSNNKVNQGDVNEQ